MERRDVIKVFGDEIPLRAKVEILNGYSAHADRTELQHWLERVRATSPRLQQVYLVHGEPEAQDAFVPTVAAMNLSVSCPTPGTTTPL